MSVAAAVAEALGAVASAPHVAIGKRSMIEINIPEVVAEVEKAFRRYERALVGNDVAELDALFWKSPHPALRRDREPLRL